MLKRCVADEMRRVAGMLDELASPRLKSEIDKLFDEHKDGIPITETYALVPVKIRVRSIDVISEHSVGSYIGPTPESAYSAVAEATRAKLKELGYDPGVLGRAESGLQGPGKETYEVDALDVAMILQRLRPEYLTVDAQQELRNIGKLIKNKT